MHPTAPAADPNVVRPQTKWTAFTSWVRAEYAMAIVEWSRGGPQRVTGGTCGHVKSHGNDQSGWFKRHGSVERASTVSTGIEILAEWVMAKLQPSDDEAIIYTIGGQQPLLSGPGSDKLVDNQSHQPDHSNVVTTPT